MLAVKLLTWSQLINYFDFYTELNTMKKRTKNNLTIIEFTKEDKEALQSEFIQFDDLKKYFPTLFKLQNKLN